MLAVRPLIRTPFTTSKSLARFTHNRQTRTFSMPTNPPLLLSPSDLWGKLQDAKKHGTRSPKPLSCTWYMPNTPKSPLEEFKKGPRIEGAVYFDLDAVADTEYSVPAPVPEPVRVTTLDNKDSDRGGGSKVKLGHMLPSKETFAQAMKDLGIEREDHVVCYDSLGVFSSPRAAWTFRAMGHEKVSVLDGGLPRWTHEGYDTVTGPPPTLATSTSVSSSSSSSASTTKSENDYGDGHGHGHGQVDGRSKRRVASYDEIVVNYKEEDKERRAIVIDARSRDRFNGTAPEPRPGLSSGHIPHSYSIPFPTLLSEPSTITPFQTLLHPDKLIQVFQKELESEWQALLNGERRVITTCGSGMTAAIIWLALRMTGVSEDSIKLYDESWTGYATRPNSKIDKL